MTEEIQNNKDLKDQWFLLLVDRIMDTVDKVLAQFTSGRWILTVAAAIIMLKVCWGNMEQAKEFKEIIAVIIYAYFNKPPEKDGQEVKKTETKITSEVKTP